MILNSALNVVKQVQLLIGFVMLTGELHLEHLALTVIDDLISRLDLI